MNPHAPLIIDIAGTVLTDTDRRRLSHPVVGGMILFGRNWQSRQQLTDLCHDIKSLRPDVLISVDHEGGRVQRFRSDGFTHLPPMGRLGALWDAPAHTGTVASEDSVSGGAAMALEAAQALGFLLASELRACGVDLAWAPVLDLAHGRSGVIGDRALHRDPVVVAQLARALIAGMREAGMAHCAKHFPGHGHAEADSHASTALDERSRQTLLTTDMQPYRHLVSELACVMPAHVIFPAVDHRPAGFSPVWLQQVLRHELGYTGAICSDDLSMEGARVAGSALDGALAALQAGCDLVMLCNQSLVDGGAPLDTMIDGLAQALDSGRLVLDDRSAARRRALLPQPEPLLSWAGLPTQARYRQAQAWVERLRIS